MYLDKTKRTQGHNGGHVERNKHHCAKGNYPRWLWHWIKGIDERMDNPSNAGDTE